MNTDCARQVAGKQNLINIMIAGAAKKDVDHLENCDSMNRAFFEARQKMIDERVSENDGHSKSLKICADEA